MAWIRTIEPSEAGDDLCRVYARITTARGKLSNIMKVQSLSGRRGGRPRAHACSISPWAPGLR
jgi:hypothetical protein